MARARQNEITEPGQMELTAVAVVSPPRVAGEAHSGSGVQLRGAGSGFAQQRRGSAQQAASAWRSRLLRFYLSRC